MCPSRLNKYGFISSILGPVSRNRQKIRRLFAITLHLFDPTGGTFGDERISHEHDSTGSIGISKFSEMSWQSKLITLPSAPVSSSWNYSAHFAQAGQILWLIQ